MTNNQITYKVEQDENFIILRIGGVVTAETIPKDRTKVDKMIEDMGILEKKNLNIIVDYKETVDVDSATLANILNRLNDLTPNHSELAFINVPEEFKNLVEIHNLQDQIRIFDSEEDARQALA